MSKFKTLSIFIILALAFSLVGQIFDVSARPLAAASDPGLGAAASFSVLAQTTITNVPTSVLSGDVGMNASGASITGLTTAEVAGAILATDLAAPSEGILSPAVQAAALAAFTTNIPGQPPTSSQGPALDGLTLVSGVYDIGAGQLNGGVLTLNGPGIYIFRASSDFVSSGSISFINGADPCNLYWRVESLATINGSSFAGTILAGTGVHIGADVTIFGRALAIGGDVTMISDTITVPICAALPASGPGIRTTASGPVDPGASIHDTARFVGGNSTMGGYITFNVYLPGDTTCASPIVVGSPVAVTGAGNYTSASYTTTVAGIYRWRAFYSGDANNLASNNPCNAAGEASRVGVGGVETPVSGLPNTGGAPIQNNSFPWSLVILGGLGAVALTLGVIVYRRDHLTKK
jgi:type VI secretion system secreted protein VgrG